MKKELEKLALELRELAEKYNKNYLGIVYINGNLMTELATDDKDYDSCSMFIMNDDKRDK